MDLRQSLLAAGRIPGSCQPSGTEASAFPYASIRRGCAIATQTCASRELQITGRVQRQDPDSHNGEEHIVIKESKSAVQEQEAPGRSLSLEARRDMLQLL